MGGYATMTRKRVIEWKEWAVTDVNGL